MENNALERALPDLRLAEFETPLPEGPMHGYGSTSPAGPVVILIHGLVVSSKSMLPVARRLSRVSRVYAPDLPGYGQSFKPESILNLTELADALARWMDAMELPPACLAGNSFGCQVLAEFALRYPEKVSTLVLQGPTVDPQARSFGRQLWRLAINSVLEQRSMGRITVVDYWSAGLRRAWATVRLALSDKIEEKLPRIDVPALVLRGEKDPLVPQHWAEQVAELLPHGRLRVIPGAAHTINYSLPAAFARAIAEFIGLS